MNKVDRVRLFMSAVHCTLWFYRWHAVSFLGRDCREGAEHPVLDWIDRCRLNSFVNLFGRASELSVKEWKGNLRQIRWTDNSRHYSLHFASLRFTSLHLGFPSGRGRLVVPPRSLQLLVGILFLIRRVIPEVDLLLPLTSRFSLLVSRFSFLTSDFSLLISHFPPDWRNAKNYDCPSDEQMQCISKWFKTFGFSLPGSISCFSFSSISLSLSLFFGSLSPH
jgi:hypothetical protein